MMQHGQGVSNNGTHMRLSRKVFGEIDDAIRRRDEESLLKYVGVRQVNLSKDPLLSAMLAHGCDNELILRLLDKTPPMHLEIGNEVGDTALHVAVAKDQVEVATRMIEMNNDLVDLKNNKGETPVHKSALFGQTASFRMLIEKQCYPRFRTKNGSNVLHCAIMGNNPELALEIAIQYEDLMYQKNSNSLSPLQVMVTVSQAFRSSLHFGIVESLIYECIPLKNSASTAINIVGKENIEGNRDVEKQVQSSPDNYWQKQNKNVKVDDEIDSEEVLQEQLTKSSRKLPTYRKVFLYLRNKIVNVTVLWMRPLLIYILNKLSNRVKELEELKIKHAQNMKLVAFMARKPDYWDFVVKGMFKKKNAMDFESEDYENDLYYNDNNEEVIDDESDDDFSLSPSILETRKMVEMGQQEFLKKLNNVMVEFTGKKVKGPTRWYESPLIVGAKMGFYDFVEQILKVCPESAQYKDLEGKNVLQVAITHGHEKIVKTIIKMTAMSNPMLPSSLLSAQDNKAKNTILHYAAETTIDDEGPPMQMFSEMKWFERVQKLVPRDMLYSINMEGRTGQELFTEKHIDMVKSGKQQLMELGKTCAGLMAAVVFASSFNIPGEKDNNHNPVFIHRTAFKVFSHAYVIGLSCAACALLVLFLSLLMSNYKEQDFRRSLPIKYSLAIMSFISALLALLVAFACNIYLNIYGGEKAQTKELVPLICELTVFPVVCGFAMIFGGADLGVWDFIRNLFH